MKKILKTLVFLFLTAILLGQEASQIDSVLLKRRVLCNDLLQLANLTIPEYYEKGELDTIFLLLDEIENKCGLAESLFRLRILLSIENRTFNENLYDSCVILHILSYIEPRYFDELGDPFDCLHLRKRQVSSIKNTNDFTLELSEKLLNRTDLTLTEKIFLQLYSNNYENVFKTIQSEEMIGTNIQSYYYSIVEDYFRLPVIRFSLLVGTWIPEDSLTVLGNHPQLGLRAGICRDKYNIDLTFEYAFLKSTNTYSVVYDNSIWETNRFANIHFGLNAGYSFFQFNRNSIQIIGGVGINSLQTLKIRNHEANQDITHSTKSLNLNLGVGYKFQTKNLQYWGIEAKYNFINYKNNGGTDLQGNTITLNLVYGFVVNKQHYRNLKAFDYKK